MQTARVAAQSEGALKEHQVIGFLQLANVMQTDFTKKRLQASQLLTRVRLNT